MPTVIELENLTPEQGFSVVGAGSPGSAPQPETTDRLGRSVSSAGDVNGDGIDDFILGAPFFDVAVPNPLPGPVPGEDTGAAYIIYGRAGAIRSDIDLASLSSADGFRIEGEAKNHYAGTSVSAAGDVNGDGIDDFIVGARYGSTEGDTESFEGKAYVVYGKTGPRSTLTLSTLTLTDGFSILGDNALDYFGTAVSAAGDINGDGFDDIVVGAPNDTGSGSAFQGGAVYVIFGRGSATRANIEVSNFSSSDGFVISSNLIGSFVGVSVSDAGDVNGDGIDDIVLGSLLRGLSGTGTYSNKTFVIYGETGSTRADIDLRLLNSTQGLIIEGDDPSARIGYSVASAGDVNGDGIDDLVIGSPRDSQGGGYAGRTYVIYGQTGVRARLNVATLTASQGFAIQGDAAGDNAGFSVSSAGDVNGDGLDDIIIGAPNGDDGGENAGEVYLIFGKAVNTRGAIDLSALSASDGLIILSRNALGAAGQSVSSAGDINNDGFDDLLIGVPLGGLPGVRGEAFIIYGRADLSPPNVIDGTPAPDVLRGTIGNDVINGLASNDVLLGNGGNDILNGGLDNDVLVGGVGNDILNGGTGLNELIGGTGDDVYIVETRTDSTFELASEGIDEVRTTFSIYALQNNIENLTYADNARHGAGVGNILDNVLTGGTGVDDLFGRAGNDTLRGGSGLANTLLGQEGDDIYLVAASGDSVIEFANQGTDTVQTALSVFTLRDHVENLVYTGSATFTGIGASGDNMITGGAGADFLSGLGGNDIIIGGSGADTMLGGMGSDQFRYAGGETGLDRILDFTSGADKIALRTSGFTRTATIDFIQTGTPVATSANSTFLYDVNSGIVSYDADGNGAGVAVQLAQLNGGLTLAAGDFIFY